MLWRATGCFDVVTPMNDRKPVAWPENTTRFPKENQRLLNVKDVEDHDMGDGGIRQSGAVLHEVTLLAHDVVESETGCFASDTGDHFGINVEAMHCAFRLAGQWQGESAIATAKFDNVAGQAGTTECFDDRSGIKETFPVGGFGHSAVASFHWSNVM